jgi:hypothetical protein
VAGKCELFHGDNAAFYKQFQLVARDWPVYPGVPCNASAHMASLIVATIGEWIKVVAEVTLPNNLNIPRKMRGAWNG